MQIVYFLRQPAPGNHSIERVFETVRGALPECWAPKVVHCPTPAHSRWWLVTGIAAAWAERGQVNHIVGDVHYAALGLPGSRCILTVHDLNHLDQLQGIRRALYRLVYFSVPLWHCAVITAISEATRDRLVEEFPLTAGRVVVVPDPIPRGYEFQSGVFNSDYPRILQVGTAPHKNVGRLVHAIAGLPCKLHIIGKLSDELRGHLNANRIDFENSVNIRDEEMLEAYVRSDLVVFASLAEGFGMPIIEANAVGRPVVTSSIEPMASVAGAAACLVDPLDTTSIRSGIVRVIQDLGYRERLVRLGLENAKRFSAETIAQSYLALYQELMLALQRQRWRRSR
jgi:glycosyltransferase involved in cell wall biosynthesis